MLLRDARDERGVRGARSRGSTRPRPATAPSSRSSRPTRSGPSSPSAPTAAPGRRCPFVSALLRRGGARPRRRGRPRDREPRALLRRPRRRRRRAARARRRRLRRGAPARGDRRRRGSAAASRAPACAGSPLDVERACREAGSRCRRGRSTGSSARATGCCAPSRRRRAGGGCASCPVEAALVLDRRARRARRRAAGAAARSSTRSRAARSRVAAQVEACLEPGELERVVWAEPDALAWAPVDVAERAARAALGRRPDRDPRLGDADDRRGRARSSAAGSGSTTRARLVVGSPYDFARAGAALRAAHDARPAQRRVHRARGRGDRLAARALRGPRARAHVELPRARRATASGSADACPYEVLVQGDAPRERLLERFRDEVDSVLLATSTFWQGVDVPGESLSLLVIDKLPFSAPGDPLHEARCEAVERGGRRLVPRLRAARPRCCSCARASGG